MGKFLLIAGLAGLIGVAAGAVGHHLFAGNELAQHDLDLASRFLLIHAAVTIGVAQLSRAGTGGWMVEAACWLFSLGMLFFGGGLVMLATVGLGSFQWLIPVGGISFMLGWLLVVVIGVRRIAR